MCNLKEERETLEAMKVLGQFIKFWRFGVSLPNHELRFQSSNHRNTVYCALFEGFFEKWVECNSKLLLHLSSSGTVSKSNSRFHRECALPFQQNGLSWQPTWNIISLFPSKINLTTYAKIYVSFTEMHHFTLYGSFGWKQIQSGKQIIGVSFCVKDKKAHT